MPTIVEIPTNRHDHNSKIFNNSDETITYEPHNSRQTLINIYRTELKPSKPRFYYTVEQDDKSYRCCQWCRHWCTRKYPKCAVCDRIVACPLLVFILLGLFLLFLFIALLTLFGLHPNINSARHYYGIISTLSILNTTKYIFNLDQICSSSGIFDNCLDIVTSTSINHVATTIVINRTAVHMTYSYILLVFCLLVCSTYRKISFDTI